VQTNYKVDQCEFQILVFKISDTLIKWNTIPLQSDSFSRGFGPNHRWQTNLLSHPKANFFVLQMSHVTYPCQRWVALPRHICIIYYGWIIRRKKTYLTSTFSAPWVVAPWESNDIWQMQASHQPWHWIMMNSLSSLSGIKEITLYKLT